MKPYENFEDLQIISNKKLGFGFISQVYLAVHKKTQEKFAVKIINLQRIQPDELKAIKREIDLQIQLNHPSIVKMYGYHTDNKSLYIILEFIEQGNLWELMNRRKLSEREIFKIFYQVVSAMCYIHKKNILHRDIKPENILITKSKDVKLCDFGFCAPFGEGQMRISQCGTQEYMPPEILNKNEQDDKVDTWCLGVLLYEMTHQRTPFKGKNLFEQKRLQERGVYYIKPEISKVFSQIIKKCLNFDGSQRPTANYILMKLVKNKEDFKDSSSKKKAQQNFNFKKNSNPISIQINNYNINIIQNEETPKKDEINWVKKINFDQHQDPVKAFIFKNFQKQKSEREFRQRIQSLPQGVTQKDIFKNSSDSQNSQNIYQINKQEDQHSLYQNRQFTKKHFLDESFASTQKESINSQRIKEQKNSVLSTHSRAYSRNNSRGRHVKELYQSFREHQRCQSQEPRMRQFREKNPLQTRVNPVVKLPAKTHSKSLNKVVKYSYTYGDRIAHQIPLQIEKHSMETKSPYQNVVSQKEKNFINIYNQKYEISNKQINRMRYPKQPSFVLYSNNGGQRNDYMNIQNQIQGNIVEQFKRGNSSKRFIQFIQINQAKVIQKYVKDYKNNEGNHQDQIQCY